jgi:hypothetical protein
MAGAPGPVSFDTRSTCKVCGKSLTPDEIVKYGDYCAAHAPSPPPEEGDGDGWGDLFDAASDSG